MGARFAEQSIPIQDGVNKKPQFRWEPALRQKILSIVIDQLSRDQCEDGSILWTVLERAKFCAAYLMGRINTVRLEMTKEDWVSWSSISPQPPPWSFEDKSSGNELPKLFQLSHLSKFQGEQLPPYHNENETDEIATQQSRLIATLSELKQQGSSWRNSDRTYRSSLKHSENSKATNIGNTFRTFRFYNCERERAIRDRRILAASMRMAIRVQRYTTINTDSIPKFEGLLDPKRRDVEIARAFTIKCVKALKFDPGLDWEPKMAMRQNIWRELRDHLELDLFHNVQSLKHLCCREAKNAPPLTAITFRLYTDTRWPQSNSEIKIVTKSISTLWKRKLLHLYLYEVPTAWTAASLEQIIQHIDRPTGLNFRNDLKALLAAHNFSSHLTDRWTLDSWLYIYVPEIKCEIEEEHQEYIQKASRSIRDAIHLVFMDDPILLSLEIDLRVPHDFSKIDQHPNKALAGMSRRLKLQHPDLVPQDNVIGSFYNDLLSKTREQILRDFLSESTVACKNEQPQL